MLEEVKEEISKPIPKFVSSQGMFNDMEELKLLRPFRVIRHNPTGSLLFFWGSDFIAEWRPKPIGKPRRK
jgi:hypothetical protein